MTTARYGTGKHALKMLTKFEASVEKHYRAESADQAAAVAAAEETGDKVAFTPGRISMFATMVGLQHERLYHDDLGDLILLIVRRLYADNLKGIKEVCARPVPPVPYHSLAAVD